MAEPSPQRETEDNTEPQNPSPEETSTEGAPEADPATEVESSTSNILAVTVESGHVPQVAECEDPSSNEQTSRVEGSLVSEIERCDPSVSTGQPVKAQNASVPESVECESSTSNEQSQGILRPSVSDVEMRDASVSNGQSVEAEKNAFVKAEACASPVSGNQVLNVDQNAVREARARATPVSSSQAMKPGERWIPTAETGAIPKTRKFTVPETDSRGEWASSSTGDSINASEGRYQMSSSSSFSQENPSDLQMWSTDSEVPQAAASYELQEMSPLLCGGDSESQLAASNIDVPVNLPAGGLEARAGPSHENGRAAPKRLYSGRARSRRSPPANIARCGAARKVLLRMSPNRKNRSVFLRMSPNRKNRGDFPTSMERDSLVAKLGSSEVTPNRYEQMTMGQLRVQQPPWRKCLNFIFSTRGLVAAVAAVFLVGGAYSIYIFISQSDEGSGVAGIILLIVGIIVAAVAVVLDKTHFGI